MPTPTPPPDGLVSAMQVTFRSMVQVLPPVANSLATMDFFWGLCRQINPNCSTMSNTRWMLPQRQNDQGRSIESLVGIGFAYFGRPLNPADERSGYVPGYRADMISFAFSLDDGLTVTSVNAEITKLLATLQAIHDAGAGETDVQTKAIDTSFANLAYYFDHTGKEVQSSYERLAQLRGYMEAARTQFLITNADMNAEKGQPEADRNKVIALQSHLIDLCVQSQASLNDTEVSWSTLAGGYATLCNHVKTIQGKNSDRFLQMIEVKALQNLWNSLMATSASLCPPKVPVIPPAYPGFS